MRNLSNKTLIRSSPIDLVREVDGVHGRGVEKVTNTVSLSLSFSLSLSPTHRPTASNLSGEFQDFETA